MALTYFASSTMFPPEFSKSVRGVLDTDVSDLPSLLDPNKRYGAAGKRKQQQKTWGPMQITILILLIIFLIVWIALIGSSVYTTLNRPMSETVWSLLMAIFIPEVYATFHGIDASRNGVGFFSKLPKQ